MTASIQGGLQNSQTANALLSIQTQGSSLSQIFVKVCQTWPWLQGCQLSSKCFLRSCIRNTTDGSKLLSTRSVVVYRNYMENNQLDWLPFWDRPEERLLVNQIPRPQGGKYHISSHLLRERKSMFRSYDLWISVYLVRRESRPPPMQREKLLASLSSAHERHLFHTECPINTSNALSGM